MTLSGLPVYISENVVEQFRFPRTKKRRIRNKWAKRPVNFRPARRFYATNDAIYVHPVMWERLRKQIDPPLLS